MSNIKLEKKRTFVFISVMYVLLKCVIIVNLNLPNTCTFIDISTFEFRLECGLKDNLLRE
jgi:hypothetical protein